MKLRRINAQRYVDEETGTYFDFESDTTPEKADEQVRIHQRIFLSKYPAEDWFGTNRRLPHVGKMRRHPPKGA
jgi:hypothetical protein